MPPCVTVGPSSMTRTRLPRTVCSSSARRGRPAGEGGRLVAGPVRVGEDDLEVGPEEGQVVVAAVPEDDVGLALGRAQDALVVDAGEDEVAGRDVRLVLLPPPDGAVGALPG